MIFTKVTERVTSKIDLDIEKCSRLGKFIFTKYLVFPHLIRKQYQKSNFLINKCNYLFKYLLSIIPNITNTSMLGNTAAFPCWAIFMENDNRHDHVIMARHVSI